MIAIFKDRAKRKIVLAAMAALALALAAFLISSPARASGLAGFPDQTPAVLESSDPGAAENCLEARNWETKLPPWRVF
jgi:hypothetical protein